MAKKVTFITRIIFFDIEAGRERKVGEEFTVSEKRAKELVKNLEGLKGKYIVVKEIDKR